jgi:hypothetical protein
MLLFCQHCSYADVPGTCGMIHEVLEAIVDTVLQLLHNCSMCKGHMVSASIRHNDTESPCLL